MLEPLLVIIGPTAVGKTALGIELAKKYNGEIISGDSMQIYRGMDIGTAKPKVEEMAGIPHHMIDILNPDQDFSVAKFQEMVTNLISEIVQRGRLPILVGGTGLYVGSVMDHYDFSEVAEDSVFRQRMEELALTLEPGQLHRQLMQVDPEAAEKLHPNDTRRVIRALEVYHVSGVPISKHQYLHSQRAPKYNLLIAGLTMDRGRLYNRINQRVDKMMEEGLIQEVQTLLDKGYSPGSQALKGLGYKEIIAYLRGEYDLEEAVRLLKRDTRHFAKRQLTWFRRDQRINWYNVEEYGNISKLAEEIGQKVAGQLIGIVEVQKI